MVAIIPLVLMRKMKHREVTDLVRVRDKLGLRHRKSGLILYHLTIKLCSLRRSKWSDSKEMIDPRFPGFLTPELSSIFKV
jgi:hypothetical protein